MTIIEITDLFGNKIQISDRKNVLKSLNSGVASTKPLSAFIIIGNEKVNDPSRAELVTTYGEYCLDSIEKIKHAKKGNPLTFKLIDNRHGFSLYEILNHALFTHVKVVPNIKNGDVFNAYHGQSSKRGVVWKGDLIKSLALSGISKTRYVISKQKEKKGACELSYAYGKEDAKSQISQLESEGFIAKKLTKMNAQIFKLAISIDGYAKPVLAECVSFENTASRVDNIDFDPDYEGVAPTSHELVSINELAFIIKCKINNGESYCSNVAPGYSFELLPYDY